MVEMQQGRSKQSVPAIELDRLLGLGTKSKVALRLLADGAFLDCFVDLSEPDVRSSLQFPRYALTYRSANLFSKSLLDSSVGLH